MSNKSDHTCSHLLGPVFVGWRGVQAFSSTTMEQEVIIFYLQFSRFTLNQIFESVLSVELEDSCSWSYNASCQQREKVRPCSWSLMNSDNEAYLASKETALGRFVSYAYPRGLMNVFLNHIHKNPQELFRGENIFIGNMRTLHLWDFLGWTKQFFFLGRCAGGGSREGWGEGVVGWYEPWKKSLIFYW